MFSYKTLACVLSVLLIAAAICWRVSTGDVQLDGIGTGRPADLRPAGSPPSPDEIPLAELEEGVLLQAGELKIMLADVERREKALSQFQPPGEGPETDTPELKASMRRHVAISLLLNRVIEQYVQEQKLQAPPDKVQQYFDSFVARQQQNGMSYDDFLKQMAVSDAELRQSLAAYCALECKAEASITEQEFTKAYDAAKKDLKELEGAAAEQLPLRRAAHILLMYREAARMSRDKPVTRTKAEAQAAAAELLAQLKAGQDFSEAAKRLSDCPSAEKGGDLDFSARQGQMVEPFAEALYKIERVGELSPVIETQFGFHIIKFTDIRSADKARSEMLIDAEKQVKQHVRQELAKEKNSQQRQQLLAPLLEKAKFNQKYLGKA